jgi:hypothetical protein
MRGLRGAQRAFPDARNYPAAGGSCVAGLAAATNLNRGYMPFFFGGAFPLDSPAGFSGCLAITLSAIFL